MLRSPPATVIFELVWNKRIGLPLVTTILALTIAPAAAHAQDALPTVEVKVGRDLAETYRSQSLFLIVDPRNCKRQSRALLTLSGKGLKKKSIASAPRCNFGVLGDKDKYLVYSPWSGWNLSFNDSDLATSGGSDGLCRYTDEALDQVDPCSEIALSYWRDRRSSVEVTWSVSVDGAMAATGKARFVRSQYAKSRPGRTLKWVRFPSTGPYAGNETGPAPKGWWQCRSYDDSRYWERPFYVRGNLYSYSIYCKLPREYKFQSKVTVVPQSALYLASLAARF